MKRVVVVLVWGAAIAILSAQSSSPPAATTSGQPFEVATIKVNRSGDQRQFIQRQPGGRVTVTNMPVRQLIAFAYQLQPFQLVGGPSWMTNDRFDIVAKLEGNPEFGLPGSGPDPIQLAMRTLFADRFRLRLHPEMREMDIYALVLAKPGSGPGSGLKPSTTDCVALAAARRGGPPGPPPPGTPFCGLMGSPGQIRMGGFPLSQMAPVLANMTGRMVIDRTGLSGTWDFTLTFQAEQRGQAPPGADVPPPDPTAPSIFTALQEQLGLKLESTKGPVDVTVIDAIEHPTED